MIETSDFVVLGAGLTGLSAAGVLGDRAVVLEREKRPGGLVRTEQWDGYWFDHVVHLLYFQDPDTERRIRSLMGTTLAPCLPTAWVETAEGTTLFPFQMHLGSLNPEAVERCVQDLALATFGPAQPGPANFEEMLLQTFGRSMCELFLFPYNRKMWKRPLERLAPSGFTWNITRPDFEMVLRGVRDPAGAFEAYNATGWYPRPPSGAGIRGMEVLPATLAEEVFDLRLESTVESVDRVPSAALLDLSDRLPDRLRLGPFRLVRPAPGCVVPRHPVGGMVGDGLRVA